MKCNYNNTSNKLGDKKSRLTPITEQTNNRPSAEKGPLTLFMFNDQRIRYLPFGAEFTQAEITRDGNIDLMFFMPQITPAEIQCFENYAPNIHFFQKEGKTCIIFESTPSDTEMMINPSYYIDNRYELLKKKKEVFINCFLYDSISRKLVSMCVFSLYDRPLEYFKKSLEINSRFTRTELDNWFHNIVWANTIEQNICNSEKLGYAERCLNIKYKPFDIK